MIILAILIIIWVISPLAFIPIVIVSSRKLSKLREEKERLTQKIREYEIYDYERSKEQKLNYYENKAEENLKEEKEHFTEYDIEKMSVNKEELIKYYEEQKIKNKEKENKHINAIEIESRLSKENIEIESKNDDYRKMYVEQSYIEKNKVEKENFKNERGNENVIKLVLVMGTIFIILAGIIFTTSTWGSLGNGGRIMVLLSVSVLFFLASIVSDSKFKLRNTAIAFYLLGSTFVPISILAVAAFELLGGFFSFNENSISFVFFTSALGLGISSYMGIKKYSIKILNYILMGSISFGIINLIHLITYDFNITSAILFILLLLSVIFKDKIIEFLSKGFCNIDNYFQSFLVFNAVVVSLFSIILTNDWIGYITIALYGILYVCSTKVFSSHKLSTLGFCILFFISILKYMFEYELENITLIFIVITFIALVLKELQIANEAFIKVSNLIIQLLTFITIIFMFITTSERQFVWNISNLVSVIALYLSVIFITYKYKSFFGIFFHILLIYHLINGISDLVSDQHNKFKIMAFVSFVIMCIYFIASIFLVLYFKNKKYKDLFCIKLLVDFTVLVLGILGNIVYNGYRYPFIFLSLALLILNVIINAKKEQKLTSQIYYIVALFYLSISIIILFDWLNTGGFFEFVFCNALIAVLEYVAYKVLVSKKINSYFNNIIVFSSSIILSICSLGFSLMVFNPIIEELNLLKHILILALIILTYFVSNNCEINIMAFTTPVSLYFVIPRIISEYSKEFNNYIEIYIVITFTLMLLLGRKINNRISEIENNRSIQIDFIKILAFIPILHMFLTANKYSTMIAFIMTAFYLMSYYRKNNSYIDKVLITMSVLSLCLAYWNQPFIEFTSLVSLEMNLLPIVVLTFCLRFIWKDELEICQKINFTVISIVNFILLISAIFENSLSNTIILSLILLFILFTSLIIKRKKWLILSSTMLLFITLYMSRNFWLSISWWIYLLVVGVILIFIASANEFVKNKSKDIKQKAEIMFIDWKW